ncbi:MAG: hypothetical protein A2806_03725 [Candidatus Terrybacteria bacterium RIFCSPHIGHO2_01_FULL_48_17]|uniref:Uncharacterized protein n=1 Tax=Candidatus Terrybacteria bacterium RIFCSPHIGHO2_01_FULL_48_17 TaxID=1802362 RepID=A0A1G2PKB0_9BACT|nr:MAG: hypothetical protein A2806_03725 [Candidatus Terrybacteria bacterium RIFCSPHIGHO2_01_FULL_48_17]OHA53912.1 MAG: hypothetical protein A3A30_03785 [Candidatus Terrybacteria bacterium RIFCSPLOWO2_01_FULL_48_14]
MLMPDFMQRSNRWVIGALLAIIVALFSALFVELIYPGQVLQRALERVPLIPSQQPVTPETELGQLEGQLNDEQTNFEQEGVQMDQQLESIDMELEGLP